MKQEAVVDRADCGFDLKTNFLCFVTVAMAVVLLTIYLSTPSKPCNLKKTADTENLKNSETEVETEAAKNSAAKRVKPKPPPKPQPVSSLKAYLEGALAEIMQALKISKTMCTPEDVNDPEMHKIPEKNGALGRNSPGGKNEDVRGAVVIYVAIALLLTSLGAAIVEAYKEKVEIARKPKPPLTRRCSLADLTVLRHSRRESMRSNSFMEEARSPLKLLGARPPSLLRQSSFPVIPDDTPAPAPSTPGRLHDLSKFKTLSLDRSGEESPEIGNRHHPRTIKLIRRH